MNRIEIVPHNRPIHIAPHIHFIIDNNTAKSLAVHMDEKTQIPIPTNVQTIIRLTSYIFINQIKICGHRAHRLVTLIQFQMITLIFRIYTNRYINPQTFFGPAKMVNGECKYDK